MPKLLRLLIVFALVWPHTSFAQATKRIKHAAAQQLCLSNTVSSANKDGVCVSATGVASFPNGTNASRVRAYRAGAQSVGASVAVVIVYNTEQYDTNNEYNPATGRFTATRAGYYQVNASYRMDAMNGGKQMDIYIYKNGVNYTSMSMYTTTTNGTMVNISDIIPLNATDYIEIQMAQADTGARDIIASASGTYVSIAELN